MSKFYIFICTAFAMVAFSMTSPAWASYVNGSGVNCREAPEGRARVVAKLFNGQPVTVIEIRGSWSRLERPGCWVSSRFIVFENIGSGQAYRNSAHGAVYAKASSMSAAEAFGFKSSAKQSRKKSSSKKSSSRKRSNSAGSYTGSSSCPCSGGNICVGPRGGRYCITSGGNKRYGV